MAYYQQIEGVQCDRAIIDACSKAVAGRGDGRVSLEDAHSVFACITDGGKVTKNEIWTLRYCLTEYNFTEAASDWITSAVKSLTHWDGEKFAKEGGHASGYYEKVDGQDCDHAIIEACRKAVAGVGDGRVSKEDAKKVLEEALDGGKVTAKEKWTLRLCLSEFNWTEAAQDWIVDELKAAGVTMKRPSTGAPPKPAKKAKVVDLARKVKSIKEALNLSQKEPEVITMLGAMLEHSLPLFKEDRHAFQTEVLEMVQKTLGDAEAHLQSEVAAAQGLVENGDAEKTKREAAVVETGSAYTACQEDTKAKAQLKAEKQNGYKATVDPLKQAQAAQKEGDEGAVAVEKEKGELESAVEKELKPMKESGGGKRQLTALMKALEKAKLEDSLIQCIHHPLQKKPEARGKFDCVVLQSLEDAVQEKLAAFAAQLTEAGPAREQRAAAVTEAQAAHDAAKAAQEEAVVALKAAKDAEEAAKDAAAAAKKSQQGLATELLNAAKTLDKASAALESFQTGPLASFTELLERAAPAPEAAEEEEATA